MVNKMTKINILDASLADKIAAGEVVERPASVIKELLENSIDAQATKIDIFIEQGGKKLIEVRDNGCGMSKEDAILSIKRHATSKIKNDFDLFNIHTMGFRGEALSAISSVSKFTLKTCEENSLGTKLFCINSEVISIEPCALNKGTQIIVEELFYNTPARLKYLKSDSAEFNAISDIVNKLSLANPKISFSLTADSKLIFKTSGNNDTLEIISKIYGLNVAKNMLYFENQNYDFKIYGYTSNISISRANRYAILSFMNSRYIKNKMCSDCIIEGYKEFLFENRYPYTILYIEADPTILDVNVHPTKQEIRISSENDLRKLISDTINKTLTSNNQISETKLKNNINTTSFQTTFTDFKTTKFNFDNNNLEFKQQNYEINEPISTKKEFEIIGQVHGTYIIAQNEEGFIIVDQHAAAERIRYEKFQKLFLEDTYSTNLLIPLILEYPTGEFKEIMENIDLLKKVKIEVEPFGNNAIKITHIPYYLEKIDLKIYVETLINQILTKKKIDLHELKDYAIATLACKASLKANSHLSNLDMETLIVDLFKCENPYTCPHGRPTMLKYKLYELQKAFKRV